MGVHSRARDFDAFFGDCVALCTARMALQTPKFNRYHIGKGIAIHANGVVFA